MQRVPVPIPSVALAATATTIYTASTGITASTIGNMSFSNTSASPVAITVYNVPTGSSAGTGNIVVPSFTLSAGQNYVPPQLIGLSIAAGSSIQALAGTAAVVNAQGGAYEVSGS
jgi:hypothetical protein